MAIRIGDNGQIRQLTFSEAWAKAPSRWARVTLVAQTALIALAECLFCCFNPCCGEEQPPEGQAFELNALNPQHQEGLSKPTSLSRGEPVGLFQSIYHLHVGSKPVDPNDLATQYTLAQLHELCDQTVNEYKHRSQEPSFVNIQLCLTTAIEATSIAACRLLKDRDTSSRRKAEDAELIGNTPTPNLFNYIGNAVDNMVREFSQARANIEIADADEENTAFEQAALRLRNQLIHALVQTNSESSPLSLFQIRPKGEIATHKTATPKDHVHQTLLFDQSLVTHPITDYYRNIYRRPIHQRLAFELSIPVLTELCNEALSHHNDLKQHLLTESSSAEQARLHFPHVRNALHTTIHLLCQKAHTIFTVKQPTTILEAEELWLRDHDRPTLPQMIAISFSKMVRQLEDTYGPQFLENHAAAHRDACNDTLEWINRSYLNETSNPLSPNYSVADDPLNQFTFCRPV